ncbi:SGNH/GDSL hydrolase family protein [Arthrobacter sp. PsM3]|uniref:SGNH/GDSL hydrolase family protein n=1 Tax=Arthrobacter sp. PsM3 TaxID=3030531 RepID=UPI00263BA535|nr:SGNH/GDSL hydrolase family protein [Arthrobacter sp. PsM3]MDN4646431.1 SGNH/GDSL hydrolase family protein [Arthrobacter sp. PsM3]
MKRHTGGIILTIVAALCVAGAAAFAVREFSSPTSKAADCARVGAGRINGGAVKVSEGTPKVAILGDSYVAGDWLDSPDEGWSRLIGKAQGWETYVDGIGGTGFTNGGPCGDDTYASRVDGILAASPRIVIVEGGLNDSEASPDKVREAAVAVLRDLGSVPNVVLLGPANAPSKNDLDGIDAALRTAASETGRQYVSALGWDLEFQPDRLHLTAAGHADFAKLVVEATADAAR